MATKSTNIPYFQEDASRKHCEICNVNFSGAISAHHHYVGKRHAKQISKLLVQNNGGDKNETNKDADRRGIKRPRPDADLIVEDGDQRVARKSLMTKDEDETALHKKRDKRDKRKLTSKDGAITHDVQSIHSDMSHCKICNVHFPGHQSAMQHYASESHVQKLNLLNSQLQAENCAICCVVLSGPEQAKMHYSGKKHMKKLEQFNRVPVSDFADDRIETQVNPQSIDADETASLEMQSEQLIALHCEVCNVNFSGYQSAEQHYASKKHAQKLNSVTNGPFQSEVCAVCHVTLLGSVQAKMHYSGKKHLKNVEQSNRVKVHSFADGETDQDETVSNKMHDERSQMNLTGEDEIVTEMQGEHSNALYCKVCNVNFSGCGPATQHYASKKHAQKLQSNKDDQLKPEICTVCHITLLGSEQAKIHYSGKKHLKKLEQLKSVSVCPTANNGTEHVTNLLKSLLAGPLRFDTSVPISLSTLVNIRLNKTWQCVICTKTFNGNKPVEDHLKSKMHNQKLMHFQNELLQSHGMKNADMLNILPCILNLIRKEKSPAKESVESIDSDLSEQSALNTLELSVDDQQILDDIFNEFVIQELMCDLMANVSNKTEVSNFVVPNNENTTALTGYGCELSQLEAPPMRANQNEMHPNEIGYDNTNPGEQTVDPRAAKRRRL